MIHEELILFVVKQQRLTNKVATCYEAGDFGFRLHLRFEELGFQNSVVQSQDRDERGNGVKNDRLIDKTAFPFLDPNQSFGALQAKAKSKRADSRLRSSKPNSAHPARKTIGITEASKTIHPKQKQ
jgi:hypothetical protein